VYVCVHTCVPGVNWGSKCPTVFVLPCAVGVVLELWVPQLLSMRPLQVPSPAQEGHKAQAPEWYTGIPVLVQWAAIAMHVPRGCC